MIRMPHNFEGVTFRIGGEDQLSQALAAHPCRPFSEETIALLSRFSACLREDTRTREWPDVMSLAFWCRQASLRQQQGAFTGTQHQTGRGLAFHIAPSNVAVNFAYSLVAGLLTGNANIVRLPSKPFVQVEIICDAWRRCLAEFPRQQHRVILVNYGHESQITDYFSGLCQARLIWGGDQTIAAIRRSPIPPRAIDIAFADRYSFSVINADAWLEAKNKARVLEDFYNDTLLTDQQACSASKLVVWSGNRVSQARAMFWEMYTDWLQDKYTLVAANVVKNLTHFCQDAALSSGTHLVNPHENMVFRVELDHPDAEKLITHHQAGYFYEYVAQSLDEIAPLCGEKCQTVTTFGIAPEDIYSFMSQEHPRGVDRFVPLGQSMQFSLLWDGYDLVSYLTRHVQVIS